MLEFEGIEELKESVGTATKSDEGYVVLPLSEYNKLLEQVHDARNAVHLTCRKYSPTQPIEIVLNKEWIYRLAFTKLPDIVNADELFKYEFVQRADDLLLIDARLAWLHAPPTQPAAPNVSED